MTNNKITIGQLLQKLDPDFYSGTEKSIAIHPGWSCDFLEVKPEWLTELKDYMEKRFKLIQSGIDEPNPADQLVCWFFENAY